MSTKNEDVKKTVLDSLKSNFTPLTSEEGDSLSGGFTSAAGESGLDDIEVNGNKCGSTSNSGCPTNTVAGCGGTTKSA